MIRYFDKGIFVLEGIDGSGKSTQFKLLQKKYTGVNYIKFPIYNSETGFFIRNYLDGKMDTLFENMSVEEKINKISMLYTCDRTMWFNNFYDPYKPLFCDRYTTSNILIMSATLYQHTKDLNVVSNYIKNLEAVEYHRLNIPRPTMTLFLDMPKESVLSNLSMRKNTDKNESVEFINACYDVKDFIIDMCRWTPINCTNDNGSAKSIEEIHELVCYTIDACVQNTYHYLFEVGC